MPKYLGGVIGVNLKAVFLVDGQPYLSGTWTNSMEGTFGTFVARMEEMNLEGLKL